MIRPDAPSASPGISFNMPFPQRLHESVIALFKKHDTYGMWNDEDVEITKQEIQQSAMRKGLTLAELLEVPHAFVDLFRQARQDLSLRSQMAMYCGKERAEVLFNQWVQNKGDGELSAGDSVKLINQAQDESQNCIPDCFKRALPMQFGDWSIPVSPPDSPPKEAINLGTLLFQQSKKAEQEEHAELICKLQTAFVEELGDVQPEVQKACFLAFAYTLDLCWESLPAEPRDWESRLKKLILSPSFDQSFHEVLEAFLQEKELFEKLNRLQLSPMDDVQEFLTGENYPAEALQDTCEWIAKDLQEVFKVYQRGSHYTQAMTPADVLEQFHKEVRGSCNRLSLTFFHDALEKLYPADIVEAILGDWYLIGTDVRDGRSFLTHERKQQLLEHAQTLQRQMEAPRLEARVKARLSRGDLLPSIKTVEQQFPEIKANDYYRRSIPVDFLVKQALVAQSIKNPARFALNEGERFAFSLLGLEMEFDEVKLNTYQKIAASLRNSGQFTEEKLKTQTVDKIKEEIERIALVEKLKLVDIPPDYVPQIRSLVQFYQEMAARYEPAIQALTEEVQRGISREYGSTLLGQSLKKTAQIHIRSYFSHQYSFLSIKRPRSSSISWISKRTTLLHFSETCCRSSFPGMRSQKRCKR